MPGCIPLQQSSFHGNVKDDHFGHYGDHGLLTIGDSNAQKTITLLPEQSYAISPEGKRYGIQARDHDFGIAQGYPYVRDQIRIYNAQGKEIRGLRNGKWIFVFAIKRDGKTVQRRFESNVSTFYYNPILHGPPN